MDPVPVNPLRSNLASWCALDHHLPALGAVLTELLPAEAYDPGFTGQQIGTTYFDTRDFALRKARKKGKHYLTLRLRCYESPNSGAEIYALSVKTEAEKWRQEINPDMAAWLQSGPIVMSAWTQFLPANLQARLMELAGDALLLGVVKVRSRRYGVEDDQDRFTLDVHIRTDRGNCLPFHVLEFKSANQGTPVPGLIQVLNLRPLKLSKFLWATEV